MTEFYFNTGVKLPTVCHAKGARLSSNNVWIIPFECEAPKNAQLLFLSDYLNQKDGVAFEIKQPSSLIGRYAYFRI